MLLSGTDGDRHDRWMRLQQGGAACVRKPARLQIEVLGISLDCRHHTVTMVNHRERESGPFAQRDMFDDHIGILSISFVCTARLV